MGSIILKRKPSFKFQEFCLDQKFFSKVLRHRHSFQWVILLSLFIRIMCYFFLARTARSYNFLSGDGKKAFDKMVKQRHYRNNDTAIIVRDVQFRVHAMNWWVSRAPVQHASHRPRTYLCAKLCKVTTTFILITLMNFAANLILFIATKRIMVMIGIIVGRYSDGPGALDTQQSMLNIFKFFFLIFSIWKI